MGIEDSICGWMDGIWLFGDVKMSVLIIKASTSLR